jgi:hypothetical protein
VEDEGACRGDLVRVWKIGYGATVWLMVTSWRIWVAMELTAMML